MGRILFIKYQLLESSWTGIYGNIGSLKSATHTTKTSPETERETHEEEGEGVIRIA
jgi:hypothetical protein